MRKIERHTTPNTEDTPKRYESLKKHLIDVKMFLTSFQIIKKVKEKKYKINDNREVVEDTSESDTSSEKNTTKDEILKPNKPGVFTFGKSFYDKLEKFSTIFKKKTKDIEDGSDEEGGNLFEFFTKLPFLATVAAVALAVKLIYDAIVPKMEDLEGIGGGAYVDGLQGNVKMLESTQEKVVYESKETGGTETRTGGSLAWRTNNPGNIMPSPFARKYGAIGEVGTNAVFPTLEIGRAAEKALLAGPSYSTLTLEKVIEKWSQGNPLLADKIAEAVKIFGANRKYYTLSDEEKDRFMKFMERYEGYVVGKTTFTKGIEVQEPEEKILYDKSIPDVITVEMAKKYMEFTARTGDEEHFEKLNPQFKRKVYKLAEVYFSKKHKKLQISSAYRSQQEQIDLPSKKKAKGISQHTRREAIDVKPSDELFLSQQPGLFKELGLQSGRTFSKPDPGHIQNRQTKPTKPPKVKEKLVSQNLGTEGIPFDPLTLQEGTESEMLAYSQGSIINISQEVNVYKINDVINMEIGRRGRIGYGEMMGV
jgi:hypothetical protein